MSLSADERTELAQLCAQGLPVGCPAIHYLSALYQRYPNGDAAEISRAIQAGTAGLVFGNFSGFVAGSDSSGFRSEVADPDPGNPQTGHFYSYVAWALEGGIDDLEYAAALGHEFVSDLIVGHEVLQVAAGTPHVAAFRLLVETLPLDPAGHLDYSAMNRQFDTQGWTERIHETTTSDWSIPGVVFTTTDDDPWHSGNSVADLRCTVAGFHFGRLVAGGAITTGAQASRWLENNILDTRTCVAIAANGSVSRLDATAG